MSLLPRRRDDIDDFQSPPEILEPLVPYIPKHWVIFEPCRGKRNLVRKLHREGYATLSSDILDGPEYDFLTYEPGFPYECVITNPPFSKKFEFLQRCYELGKPFALLMPLAALDTVKRQSLYKQHGIELLVLPKQVDFRNLSGKIARFACAWFCHRVLPHPLIFS